MDNVKMNIKKAQQGLDGFQGVIALTIKGADALYIENEPLKNINNKNIGTICCRKGKIFVYVNPCFCIRPNNVKPFGLVDAIKIDVVRSMVLETIQEYMKKHLKNEFSEEYLRNIKITQAECNITLKISGTDISNVIDFFEKAFDETTIHRKRIDNTNKKEFEKKSTSCCYVEPKKYLVKIYDKTAEQNAKKNFDVEENLLRIEIKFFSTLLKKMYKGRNTLDNVLTKEGLIVLCQWYKRAFEEIEENNLKPYLSYCKQKLYDSLCNSKTGYEIAETVGRHKDLIVDIEVLRQALKKWYKECKKTEDRSHKVIYHYQKNNFGIPIGVLNVVKMFHLATG